MREMQAALSVSGDEHWITLGWRRHGIVHPHAAPAEAGPRLSRQVGTRHEPQDRLRLRRRLILED